MVLRSGRREKTRVGGKARFSAERRIQSRIGLMNPFDGTQQGLLDEHLSRPIYRNRSVSASPTGQIPGCSASGVARFAGQKSRWQGKKSATIVGWSSPVLLNEGSRPSPSLLISPEKSPKKASSVRLARCSSCPLRAPGVRTWRFRHF
jgi:hypothetical protein